MPLAEIFSLMLVSCTDCDGGAMGQQVHSFVVLVAVIFLVRQLTVFCVYTGEVLDLVSGFRQRKDCFHRYYRYEVGLKNLESSRAILLGLGEQPLMVNEAVERSITAFENRYGTDAARCSQMVSGKGEIYHEGQRFDVPNWVYRFRGGWD